MALPTDLRSVQGPEDTHRAAVPTPFCHFRRSDALHNGRHPLQWLLRSLQPCAADMDAVLDSGPAGGAVQLTERRDAGVGVHLRVDVHAAVGDTLLHRDQEACE